MSPYLAAGILAAAYKLGLLPETLSKAAPATAAGLLGYGVGHEGHAELLEQLKRSEMLRAQSEELRRREAHEAFMREQALRQILDQQARDERLHEMLAAAMKAHDAREEHR